MGNDPHPRERTTSPATSPPARVPSVTFIQNKRASTGATRSEPYHRLPGQEVEDTESVLVMVESVPPASILAAGVRGGLRRGNDLKRRAKSLGLKLQNRLGDNEEEAKSIYEEFRSGKLRKVIATGVYRQGVDFPALSVLIRADGSPSPIASSQIPGRLSRLSPGKDTAVLVDFRDRFNDTALNNWYRRSATYRKNGWTIDMKGEL